MTLPLNESLALFNNSAKAETISIDDIVFYIDTETIVMQLATFLNIYYTPVLIVLGCFGNLISIVVFYKSRLRVQSTSQYLSALALSDTLFLCQLLAPWLQAVGATSLFAYDGFCQLIVYLTYVTCSYSSWLVVAFTSERFVAVVYPLRLNAIYTVNRARQIIGALAAAALLVNVPVLRFAVRRGDDCDVDELVLEHAARFNVFDTVVSFTLPLTAIVVLNSCIVWGVCRARAPLTSQLRPSSQRVTRMLLVVSSVFVLLNLPAYTLRIMVYANIDMGQTWTALQQIFLLCFNTNFGINFLLYCVTGQNFRQSLRETFPCLRRRKESVALCGHVGPARDKSTDVEPAIDTSSAEVETARHEPLI